MPSFLIVHWLSYGAPTILKKACIYENIVLINYDVNNLGFNCLLPDDDCLTVIKIRPFKLYLSGCQSHANWTCMAACSWQITVNCIHVACDWQPHGYNLHAISSHSGTIWMRLATSRMQFLHALVASTVQCRQIFGKHTARTINWIKTWGNHYKIWDPKRHMYHLGPIHQHYAWPDPIS